MGSQHKVLFLGDSWADSRHGKNALEEACPSATVKQVSQGGSTASMWASGSLLENSLDELIADNFVPDYAWVSLGGNDFMYNLCLPFGGVDSVAANIRSVAEQLEEEFPAIEQILLTGYALNPIFVTRPCALRMRSVYTDYDYTPKTKVVLVDELFGGVLSDSETRSSDFKFFSDPIHLNRDGYDVLFGYEPVALALGCLDINTTPDPTTLIVETVPPSTLRPAGTPSPPTTSPGSRRTAPPSTGSPSSSPTATETTFVPTAPTTVVPNFPTASPTVLNKKPLNSTESPTLGPANFLSPLDGGATSGAAIASPFGCIVFLAVLSFTTLMVI